VSRHRCTAATAHGVGGAAADLPPSGHLDPGEYLDLQPVGALRHGFDDDDLSLP